MTAPSLYDRVLAHNAGRTHWDGCAADHLVCALWQRVENATQSTMEMGAEILGLRDTVSKLVMERDALRGQLDEVSSAIGSVRWMDPPDGGSVSLGEQVSRMRAELAEANAEVPLTDPMRAAWEAYKLTAEYANSRKWALFAEHVDGSLWAAFVRGWRGRRT